MSPDDFVDSLWRGVSLQYLVSSIRGDPCGVVAVYDMNLVHGFAYLRVHGSGNVSSTVFEGSLLFVDIVFERFPIEKLYVESGESEFRKFESAADSFMKVEGRLSAHLRCGDGREDLVVGAIYRDRWPEIQRYLSPRRAPGETGRMSVEPHS